MKPRPWTVTAVPAGSRASTGVAVRVWPLGPSPVRVPWGVPVGGSVVGGGVVGAAPTAIATGADVLAEAAAVPVKRAVTERVPAVGKEVDSVARPDPSRAAVPSDDAPARSSTVPLVTGPPTVATAAVSTTCWPTVGDVVLAVSVVVDAGTAAPANATAWLVTQRPSGSGAPWARKVETKPPPSRWSCSMP